VNAVRAAERAGAADVERWLRDPSLLATLPLGAFDEAPLPQVVLRRLLLAVRIPPRLVRPLSRREGFRHAVDSYCYWRGVRRALADDETWRRLTQGTTIVMYHAFAVGSERASRFVVPPRAFWRQMRWLTRRRPVLALDDVLAHRRTNRLPPAGAVVVTIDDGYDDVRSHAHPVLRALGVAATLFVVTERMGEANRWDADGPLAGRPLVSWPDTTELHRQGLALGAHTRTHPRLPDLPPADVDAEVAGSRADLADALGEPVETFAYPYGRWDEATAQAVARAGFGCAVSVAPGRNCAATPPYALRRVEIRGDDSPVRFVLAVVFGDSRIVERVVRRLGGR
jgi:peptidoglycan/xylan/chitin deacetylase (PgdA/CDA1 family)